MIASRQNLTRVHPAGPQKPEVPPSIGRVTCANALSIWLVQPGGATPTSEFIEYYNERWHRLVVNDFHAT